MANTIFSSFSASECLQLVRQDKALNMTFLQYTEMLLNQMAVSCLKRPARKVSPVKVAKISKNASRYTGSHEAFFYRRYHNNEGDLVENMRNCI